MRFILAVYFWTLLALITIVLFSVLLFIRLVALLTRQQRYDIAIHWIASLWGWLLLKSVPVWRLSIDGHEHLDRRQCHVIVANHESMADIWAVFCIFTQFRWLAKSSLFHLPLIGPAMTWAGYVPVNRGDRTSHTQAMRQAAQWLRLGISMFFFPEGTRTSSGEIGPFKMGAFKLAVAENMPILPLVIKGARDLLPKGSLLPGPAHVRIRILPAVRPAARESIEEFAARVRQVIVDQAKII